MEELYNDLRRGWFKLVIPTIADVFGPMINDPQVRIVPFIFCKIDQEMVSFDTQLSVPMYALDRVVVPLERQGSSPGLSSLNKLGRENSNHCYIPTSFVTVIIPIDDVGTDNQSFITMLINITSASGIVIPDQTELKNLKMVRPFDPKKV